MTDTIRVKEDVSPKWLNQALAITMSETVVFNVGLTLCTSRRRLCAETRNSNFTVM